MTEAKGYKARRTMHFNKGAKGSAWLIELEDYPGISILDDYDKKTRKTKRLISYEGKDYATIEEAVTDWKAK